MALPVSAAGTWEFNQVEMTPLSAVQLGDVALVSPELFKQLDASPGCAAMLSSGENQLEVLLYPITRHPQTVSIKKSLRDKLDVQPGTAIVKMRLLDASETTLERIDSPIRIESQQGDQSQWPGVVLGAPHGDCDMYTGEIVVGTTELCKVPSVCAYGSRITYLGRWIDVNRPLQRRPRPSNYGILPYRDWTDEATAIYTTFKDKTHRIGTPPSYEPGSPPLDLYLDFHGHDLSVTDAEGKNHYRNVFECMTRGFTTAEIQQLKVAFDSCVQAEYGDQSPKSYWGNLIEDRKYEYMGVQTDFYYSGLGGRVYGVLNSEVSRRAIHIESPDSMRIDPQNRPKTSRVLAAYLKKIQEEIVPTSIKRQSLEPAIVDGSITKETRWCKVPAGAFLMGAPQGEGWSIEWPRHWVQLDAYEISATEVTCRQYADFLNKQIAEGNAVIDDKTVRSTSSGKDWCSLWPHAPLALLTLDKGQVVYRDRRADHPVNYVTWYGAKAMAEANNASLPTEAQWEKAAGWDSNTGRAYRTGISRDRFAPSANATLMNSNNESENVITPSTTPVGSYKTSRSPVGCLDMSGNVWEWTLDWQAGYKQSQEPLINPIGPDSGTMKSVRGGGWDTERQTATPSFRLGVNPDVALPNVGFRLVREQQE